MWSGSVSKQQQADQTYRPEQTNLLVDLVKAANKTEAKSDDETYPPPAAPSADVVFGLVFAGFGENMPTN